MKRIGIERMRTLHNEKTAEIVGLSLGDGSLTVRKNGKLRYQLRSSVEEKRYYDAYIKPLFNTSLGNVLITHYEGRKPYYGIYSENQKMCNFLKIMGIPVGIKGELNIPAWIKNNTTYLKRFIRGFVDTDGSVFCGRDYNHPKKKHVKIRMSVASVSYNIIEEVNKSLKQLGIHNLIIKPYKQKNSRWKNLNKIQIDGPNVEDYFRIIGSKNPKHISKYKIWRRFGFCPPYTTLKQRKDILNGKLNLHSFYRSDNSTSNNAGMSESGQKSTVEDLLSKAVCLSGFAGSNPVPRIPPKK